MTQYKTRQIEKSKEEIYLTEIHNKLSVASGLLDLHTYFYWKGLQVCPICNEWLIMRSKPQLTR